MSRYRGPRLRIIRRLGELPGLTQKVCGRNYPAGQHGPKKRMVKESQYSLQLKEKQKLRSKSKEFPYLTNISKKLNTKNMKKKYSFYKLNVYLLNV